MSSATSHTVLLERCGVMINLAGMNSVRSAFEHGIPLVLLPLVAEHAFNAERCAAMGMALVLDVEDLRPENVRTAVRRVLNDPTYRAQALRVRGELGEMPGPDRGVRLLAQLCRHGGPGAPTLDGCSNHAFPVGGLDRRLSTASSQPDISTR